jgi:hypothetical protein
MAHYVIGDHAWFEMKRRGLSEKIVRSVLEAPDQQIEIRPGRVVVQSQVKMSVPPKTYLIRVFVDVDRNPQEVVTVYRTSKVSKYWRQCQ